jgi:hypothetical protein
MLVMAPSAGGRAPRALPQDWLAERGATRFEAICDLAGGFPGFAQRGGQLTGAQLRISDAYLLIDEGQPHGFGLPIQWLEGAAIIPGTGQQRSALRVAYRDGGVERHMTISFRPSRLPLRPARGAASARTLLLDLGLPDRDEDRLPALPDMHVAWDQTHGIESENVIWTGPASAPLHVGDRPTPGPVWLTTESLLWGSAAGNGLNRVSLSDLHGVITGQDEARRGMPAVYVAYHDPDAGRIDLPFLFDRHLPERNLRERGAFLVSLRSRGIPLGLPAPLIQPWRIAVHRVGSLAAWSPPEDDQIADSNAAVSFDFSDEPLQFDDVMVAECSEPSEADGLVVAQAPTHDDYALATEWVEDHGVEQPSVEPEPVEDGAAPPMERGREYEAAALAVFEEALLAIRDRLRGNAAHPLVAELPAPALKSAAFAELSDLTASGQIDPAEARARQTRLTAIAEAGWRLRSLVELRDAGHISDAALARKRAEISSDLTARILPERSR